MKIAKADTQDLDTTLAYLMASDLALDAGKFSMACAYDNWEYLDEDDEDRKLIERLRKDLAEEEGVRPERLDSRILMYEFLQHKFAACNCNWRRVYYAATALIDFVCDPNEDHLATHPCFEMMHVAPEQ
jgi:hypothetical protein